jgi:hypothetical protein
MSAPQAMLDALMFSLRSGCAALERPDVLTRLTALDEQQIGEVRALLLANRSPVVAAAAWSSDEISKLMTVWMECKQ